MVLPITIVIPLARSTCSPRSCEQKHRRHRRHQSRCLPPARSQVGGVPPVALSISYHVLIAILIVAPHETRLASGGGPPGMPPGVASAAKRRLRKSIASFDVIMFRRRICSSPIKVRISRSDRWRREGSGRRLRQCPSQRLSLSLWSLCLRLHLHLSLYPMVSRRGASRCTQCRYASQSGE